MNKEVIYIDVDDDITSIISKVKSIEAKIIAIVPPKRIGILQSAVNLRILQKVASNSKKHIVIITSDQTLIPLAAAANIPVAKSLQSKPEIPEVPAIQVDDDGGDIIDGSSLADTKKLPNYNKKGSNESSGIRSTPIEDYKEPDSGQNSSRGKSNKQPRVPNFNNFRKKLLIIGGGVVLLIIFLIWAMIFAPRGTVIISAKTSPESISTSVNLSTTSDTDVDKSILKAVNVTDKKETSVEFVASGKREEGDKAHGTMTLNSTTPDSVKIPVGTGFSNGNCTFTTKSEVELPGVSPGWNGSGFSVVPGKVNVKVEATQIGDECNLSSRKYESTIDKVTATGSAMEGGSKRTVTFVTQADVQNASEKIAQNNNNEQKNILVQKLGKNVRAIEDSFIATGSETNTTPQVNQEAQGGKAKLIASVTYSMYGVNQSDLDKFLISALKNKISKENNRRVYNSGVKTAKIADFKKSGDSITANITSKGQVGPKILDSEIKDRVKGKRFGDIQADLQSIEGVRDVSVELSPFWVNTIPNDTSKITIKFNIDTTGR